MIMTATMCLALNMFFEARNEPIAGQQMVAEVTLNRVASSSYPDTICDVVYQNQQFSWTHDGLTDDPTKMSYLDKQAWEEIYKTAAIILSEPETYLPGTDTTHYHADYVWPYWADDLEYVSKVGTHLFYKNRES
jgi:spore germination cell wall hydrolase CwlJ-like protein